VQKPGIEENAGLLPDLALTWETAQFSATLPTGQTAAQAKSFSSALAIQSLQPNLSESRPDFPDGRRAAAPRGGRGLLRGDRTRRATFSGGNAMAKQREHKVSPRWWRRMVWPAVAVTGTVAVWPEALPAGAWRWGSKKSATAPAAATKPAAPQPAAPPNGFATTIHKLQAEAQRRAKEGDLDGAIACAQRARKIAEASAPLVAADPTCSVAEADQLVRELIALRTPARAIPVRPEPQPEPETILAEEDSTDSPFVTTLEEIAAEPEPAAMSEPEGEFESIPDAPIVEIVEPEAPAVEEFVLEPESEPSVVAVRPWIRSYQHTLTIFTPHPLPKVAQPPSVVAGGGRRVMTEEGDDVTVLELKPESVAADRAQPSTTSEVSAEFRSLEPGEVAQPTHPVSVRTPLVAAPRSTLPFAVRQLSSPRNVLSGDASGIAPALNEEATDSEPPRKPSVELLHNVQPAIRPVQPEPNAPATEASPFVQPLESRHERAEPAETLVAAVLSPDAPIAETLRGFVSTEQPGLSEDTGHQKTQPIDRPEPAPRGLVLRARTLVPPEAVAVVATEAAAVNSPLPPLALRPLLLRQTTLSVAAAECDVAATTAAVSAELAPVVGDAESFHSVAGETARRPPLVLRGVGPVRTTHPELALEDGLVVREWRTAATEHDSAVVTLDQATVETDHAAETDESPITPVAYTAGSAAASDAADLPEPEPLLEVPVSTPTVWFREAAPIIAPEGANSPVPSARPGWQSLISWAKGQPFPATAGLIGAACLLVGTGLMLLRSTALPRE
jgi:hypothetical protein